MFKLLFGSLHLAIHTHTVATVVFEAAVVTK